MREQLTGTLRWLLAVGCLTVAGTGCQVAADGYNLNGVKLYQQGNFDAAVQRFQEALATNPGDADAYYNLAATTHRLGSMNHNQEQLKQAETLYNQCLDLDPNHVDCHRGLAVLLVETNRPQQAFTLLKNWAAANPQLSDARVELARLYQEFGDLETAKLHLNQAVMSNQHNYRAWAALGSIREQMGDPSQALANYQRAYNLNQFQPGVVERIAVLNRELGGGTATDGTRIVNGQNTQRY